MKVFTTGLTGKIHEAEGAESPLSVTLDNNNNTVVIEFPSRSLMIVYEKLYIKMKDKDGS